MAIKRGKIFKRLYISFSLIVIILGLFACTIAYLVYNPSIITTIIVEKANENITGELMLEKADIHLFSSYPNVLLRVYQGNVKSKMSFDTLQSSLNYQDTLFRFDSCSMSFDLAKFLFEDRIVVNNISIYSPSVHLLIDQSGHENWDITLKAEDSDTVSQFNEGQEKTLNIEVNNINIINGKARYEDLISGSAAKVNNLYLNSKLHVDTDKFGLSLKLDGGDIFYKDEMGDVLCNDLKTALRTEASFDLASNKLILDSTKLKLNNTEIFAIGQISFVEDEVYDINLITNIKTAHLDSTMLLIPQKYYESNVKFRASGQLEANSQMVGLYDKNHYPTIKLDFKLGDASLDYPGLPNKIDNLEVDLFSSIDHSKKTPSFIDLKLLSLKSTGIDLQVVSNVSNILDSPYIKFNTNADVKLEEIKNTLPIERIQLKGEVKFDLNGELLLSDLLDSNYGNIDANGVIELSNVNINYAFDSLIFNTKRSKIELGQELNSVSLTKEESKLFHGDFNLSHLKLKVKDRIDVKVDRFNLSAKTTPWEDSTTIAELRSKFKLTNANFEIGDTIDFRTTFTKGILNISPGPINKDVPVFHSEFRTDSAIAKINKDHYTIKNGKYIFDFKRKSETNWPITGFFKFDYFYVFTPSFPKLIRMNETRIEVRHGRLILKKAKVRVGKSKMELTGQIYDFQKTVFKDQPLRAKFEIDSKFLNVNQLIRIMNNANDSEANMDFTHALKEEESEVEKDTLNAEIFQVPYGIDLTLKSRFSRVIFSDMEFKDISGNVIVKDGLVHLQKLRMKSETGNMITTLRYKPTNRLLATSSFNIKFIDVDIAGLIKTLPYLDAQFPMTKAFEGTLNFGIRGRSKLNSNLEIIPSTVKAIARAEGKNLVLMDSETFTSLSKTLMFKNKERNMIDSADFQMSIDNGKMTLYPSLVSVDRYDVAIGGTFNLDYTYEYQISVLKSPAPFKAGIDVMGDPVDYTYKLTKAKYKYLFSDKEKQLKKADTSILNKKADIISKIKFD